jgi:glycosyltransferase involved in cell wall biosynthesis
MIRCGWVLTNLAGGGAERIPLLLAPAFQETELEVVLLKDLVEHDLPVDGPRVETLSSSRHSLAWTWAPILTRMVRKARALDVLVAGLEWAPTFFAVVSGVLSDKPVVATVHTDLRRYREIEPLPRGWWSAMRRALQRCAAVVAVSEGVGDCVLGLGVDERRLHVIPNPVKPFAGHRPSARDGRARLLTVGGLKRIKGVDLVLDTAHHLGDLDFEWTLVGDGPERQALQARATELGLRDRIKFAGFRPDPTPFYGAADIYILPSRMEGAPLALVEAMSAGLPILATRCGSVVEGLVDPAIGELVPNEDTAALSVAIRSLLTDPERRRRLGNTARGRAQAFEPSLVGTRYEELLAAVVAERRTARRRFRRD